MGILLMLAAPRLLFVCVANVLAALVLFEVSAAKVVVALKVVPAEAKTDNRKMQKATLIP